MLSLVFLCLMLAGVASIVPVPLEVRRLSVGALSAICFLASLVFLFDSLTRKD